MADTTSPVISAVTVSPPLVAPEDSVSVTVTATDNTAVSIVTANGVELANSAANTWSGEIPADDNYGLHAVTVIASDAASNTATDTTRSYRTAQTVGIVNRNALRQPTDTGRDRFLYKVWGEVDVISPNSFSVNDGSGYNTVIQFPNHDACNGDYIIARGILDPSNVPAVLTYAKYQVAAQSARTPINLSPASLTIGKDLQATMQGTTIQAAPPGNLRVTFTSLNPELVKLSDTPTGTATEQVSVQVNAGSTAIPPIYVHAYAAAGTAKIAVTAPGCQGAEATVTLVPSGFAINTSGILTTTFSGNTQVNVVSYRLNPSTLGVVSIQNLRTGLTVQPGLISSNTTVGTVATTPLSVSAGASSAAFHFDPANAGTTTLSVVQPAGFTSSFNQNQITATVTAPNISVGSPVIGKDLQVLLSISLGVTPPVPVNVSVTMDNPAIAVLSKGSTTPGTSSVTFEGVTTTSAGNIYVHGLALGQTSFAVSAPGYNNATSTVTVDPSGFIIDSPSAINTTSFSTNTTLNLKTYRLHPTTFALSSAQSLRAGLAQVAVTPVLSNTTIGSLINLPAIFQPGESSKSFTFDPSGAGTGTINLTQPAGFTTPANQNNIPVTVTAPGTTINSISVGKNLQVLASASLAAAPPAALSVTISVDDETTALLATTATAAGSKTIVFNNITTAAIPNFYVHGLQLGQTTLRISAPGYTSASSTATVTPAGFAIETNSISTTALSPNSNVSIRAYRLTNLLATASAQNLRPGASAVIDLSLSNSTIGGLSATSVMFSTNDLTKTFQFDPSALGTGTLSISTPSGFSTPTSGQSIQVTVDTPTIGFTDQTVGRDLQIVVSPTLQTAPQVATNFTIQSSDPATLLISTSATTVGAASALKSGVTTASLGQVYLQALALGVATITVSGNGYETRVANVTINPSGFVIEAPSSITTKTTTSTVKIAAALLNPITLNYSSTQQVRAGKSVSIPTSLSNPAVGSLNPTSAIFNGGDSFKQLTFTPASVGTSTLSITNPIDFSTPSNMQSIPVTVNP